MKKGLLILAAASLLSGAKAFAADPAIVVTFPEGTESARLGVNVIGGTYSIDWGNGEEVVYEASGYCTHDLLGTTVKIYSDSINQFVANGQKILTADLSKADKLKIFHLNQNGMTSLVLGEHPELTGIYAYENKLTTLNTAGCSANKVIDVHSNIIEGTLDLSNMKNISTITVYDNKLTGLVVPESATVWEIDCSYNKIESLSFENLPGVNEISCSENKLTSITLSGLNSMEELYVDANRLTSIDLSGCPALEKIMAAENLLESIDLSKTPDMEGVYVQDNKLTSIDLSASSKVRYLNINNNSIANVDVKGLANLSILNAENNGITAIDLSANSRLSTLSLAGNELTSIDLSGNPSLYMCTLSNNKLTSIDVKGKSSLSTLKVDGNQLTDIDVSTNGYLYNFDISNNRISTLFLENNAYLYYLYCANNQLAELDVEANNMLWCIDASGNKLTHLNVVQQVNLRQLLLQSNELDAAAIAEIIADLPKVDYEVDDTNKDWMRQFNISFNPGTSTADVAKAEEKGWFVTADYKNTAIGAPVVDTDADVVETLYYNASGVASATPFKGFNIRVDVLSNGATRTSKVVVK